MKKVLSLLLALGMCLSLCACDIIDTASETSKAEDNGMDTASEAKAADDGIDVAYEASKAAYDNIKIAYAITEQFGDDLYEAWRIGIYDKKKIISGGVNYLAANLSLSANEIRTAAAYTLHDLLGGYLTVMSEDEKKQLIDLVDGFLMYELYEEWGVDLFSFCIKCVSRAYIINRTVDEVEKALDAAKAQMKELTQKHSDYEHYPKLKEYYTTTSAFFDFCRNPNCSFEQFKDTINDYKNDARDCINDLNFIFED